MISEGKRGKALSCAQGDQLYIDVCFWYLVSRDLSSPVHACTVVYTGPVTFNKVPEPHGHVYLVGLYQGPMIVINLYY